MDERLAGLCGRCAHCRVVGNARGSKFLLCELAASDPRFPRYPRQPVARCIGFDEKAGDEQRTETPPD